MARERGLRGRRGCLEEFRGDLFEGLGLPVQVALDLQPKGTSDLFHFGKAEVPELLLVSVDQTKERILPIELGRVMWSTGLCRVAERLD